MLPKKGREKNSESLRVAHLLFADVPGFGHAPNKRKLASVYIDALLAKMRFRNILRHF
jgi:hypothetical protein